MQKKSLLSISVGFLLLFLCSFTIVQAQQENSQTTAQWNAQVIEILDEKVTKVPGTDVETTTQTLIAEITSDARQGERVTYDNDFLPLRE